MTLLNKEPVKRAEKCLKEFDEKLSVVELENSAKTALDAANSLNCEVGAIVKSLLIKIENDFLLCLVSGDKRCSLNKLKKISEKKNVRMASADEVKSQTGYTIGGVSPVGHINDIPIFVDIAPSYLHTTGELHKKNYGALHLLIYSDSINTNNLDNLNLNNLLNMQINAEIKILKENKLTFQLVSANNLTKIINKNFKGFI